jgi:S1-C subfamily serine protease
MERGFQGKLVMALVVVMLLAGGFVVGTMVISTHAAGSQNAAQTVLFEQRIDSQPMQQPPDISHLTEIERTFADIYQAVSPSVVAINVSRQTSLGGFPDGIEGSGSGFVIDTQGHVMTNYHVVDGAEQIEVNFFDGTITRAEVVGADADSDLAVLRVDLPADRLFPVSFGSVNDLVIGQTVLALGSPFGQRWTLTSGIISALERDIQGLGNYRIGSAIQTDAPINPGNSGGPLLNLRGEVIGVNSQIISQTRSNSGIGFAVPADLAVRVSEELIERGSVAYSWVGIVGSDIRLDIIDALNLPDNQRGMLVLEVSPGSPADRAGMRSAVINNQRGLEAADIIVAIDERPITGFASLIAYLAIESRPGDTANMTVLRDGELVNLDVTLGTRGQQQ